MDECIAQRFHDDVTEGISSLPWDIGYRPPLLSEMVHRHGAVEAARRALTGPRPSDGFLALARHNLLHRSIEAWVLRPEYASLFSEGEREEARRRLERHGFPLAAYLHGVSAHPAGQPA